MWLLLQYTPHLNYRANVNTMHCTNCAQHSCHLYLWWFSTRCNVRDLVCVCIMDDVVIFAMLFQMKTTSILNCPNLLLTIRCQALLHIFIWSLPRGTLLESILAIICSCSPIHNVYSWCVDEIKLHCSIISKVSAPGHELTKVLESKLQLLIAT